jgi:hypothetical protein
MASHMVSFGRRAFEATVGSNSPEKVEIDLPAWGVLLLGSTVAVFIAAMFMVEYTYGRLIPALLMIESPQEDIVFEPVPTDEADPTIAKDPEQQQAKGNYITSSFCRATRHLSSIGGFRSRFRGVGIYFVNSMVVNIVASAIPYLPRSLSAILARVACAQLTLGWTLIVISEPSPKSWFRRIPSANMWKKVAGPTAILAVAEQLATFIPYYLAVLAGLTNKPNELVRLTPGQKTAMGFEGFAITILGMALSLCLVLPANVALTRVQASLLPDAEETIVPFDRGFGGKVEPEIVGGSGVIGVMDAWKSFDWAARVRLVKAYLKVFAMQIALGFAFFIVLIGQMFLIVGSDWSKAFPSDGKDGL